MGWTVRSRAWLWLAAGLLAAAARAQDGVGEDRILLGQSAPMSGPSGQLGRMFLYGARAYFDKVNAGGGVHGRKIRVVSLDDRADAAQAVANTTQLIHGDKVFALFGYAGAPSLAAALPLIERAGIPLFAPVSGAHFLHQPFNPLIFNVRASHARETDYLLRQFQGNGRRDIALLYQDDEFGRAALETLRKRLGAFGMRLVAALPAAADDNPEAAVKAALRAAPDMVIAATSYAPAAAFIVAMRRAGYGGGFAAYSLVGGRPLMEQLDGAGAGTVITQVVPFPWRAQARVVYESQKLCGAGAGAEYSFVALEGFIAARVLVEGLRRAGRNLRREGLVQALETINPGNYDGGGFDLRFAPDNHNGSDFVDLTAIGSHSRFVN